jgi:hypothetical protein
VQENKLNHPKLEIKTMATYTSETYTSRKNVTHKMKRVFDLRNDEDIFKGKDKDYVMKNKPNVDHVLEIQMLDKVWYEAPVGVRTRAGQKQFSQVKKVPEGKLMCQYQSK